MGGMTYACRNYGDHVRQRVGIWEFASTASQSSGYWLIFIHGGAWRDPSNTHEDFLPAINHIVSSSDIPSSAIRGFASIDYRLSYHPGLPQDPTTTPDTEQRIAQHPDHISDVRMALRFLTENYGLSAGDGGERVKQGNAYVLIGHSAGATLAFQLFMTEDTLCGCIPQPAAVIGISGIYDLVGLDDRHTGYTSFISSAFGDSKENWKRASPATYPCSFAGRWTADKPTILAWSAEDSLIDEPEIDAMSAKLSQDGIQASVIKDLTGEHDDVWREGSQIHRLVQLVIGDLQQGRNTRLIN